MRTSLALVLAAASPLTYLSAQVGDRSDVDRSKPPSHWNIPEAPVRTPEESMARFDLPAGFRVELVAAEPLVQDPIAITFDERGRLWVLEWPSYNWEVRSALPDLPPADPPKSRVVILEDTDGDGRMDRRTVFMDNFDWPRGIQVLQDGALILKLPELVLAQDRNGDGKVDQEEVVVKGLVIPANPHGAQSNLLRALDNWIYGSQFPQRFRPSPGGWTFQPSASLRGQWGLSQDNYGRFVYSANGTHLIGDYVPPHYFARNPHYPVTAGIDVRLTADQSTWPHAATPGSNRRGQLRDEDGSLSVFTSNTAPTVYRGDQFPAEYVGNAFLGEVSGRFIRRSLLTEKDGLITAENAYAAQRREFLFSHDERFRPTFTANGPDGALYIADMYRGVIEGHLFVTSYLQQQIVARKLQQPFNGMGRVYRIVHESRPRQLPPSLEGKPISAWVERLAHPNGFWRDTAQRLIVQSGQQQVVPAVRQMALNHADELARLHALWTLEGLGAIQPEILRRALADSSFRVRQAALRLSEPFLQNEQVAARVRALAEDERIEVRRQLLFTLGEGGAPFEATLVRVLERDLAAPITVEAALSGLRGREYALLAQLLSAPAWKTERPGAAALFSALAQAVLRSNQAEDLNRVLALVADDADKPLWARLAVLQGLAAPKEKRPTPLPASLAALITSQQEPVRKQATALNATWTSAPPATAAARPALPRGEIFAKGQALYAICSACHGLEGQGQPGVAPTLTNSAVAGHAQPDELIRSILFGRNQDRSNTAYPDMPPLGGMSDEDIAAIASYVRARWGGHPLAVGPSEVGRIRGAAEGKAAAP